ncbi:hypothetical protein Daus18300_014428 [Diaporthe australafricana]|uniref:Xylanolytic transcriptional activator regulatory domain-containing protein n=1 Tax=Diaporthe australafricana TaxID=127596 RepID=A0ABR3VVA2_9PEZI
MMVAAQQQQQQQSVMPVSQEHRTQAQTFIQQPVQPFDLASPEANTYMISTLNWISPSMDFDLSEFDYNPMASNEQYWGPFTDVNNLPGQSLSTAQMIRPVDDQSLSTPGTLPDSNDAETPGTSYVDNKGARQPRNGRYANRIFEERISRESPRACPELPVNAPEPDGFSFALAPLPDSLVGEYSDTWIRPFNLEQYSFTALLALYRRRFDPKVLPMVHLELDSEKPSSWVVKLAMSAIGSQYLETGDMELAVALHEFLRRFLRQRGAIFSTEILTAESLGLFQSKLLNYIGMAYCGSRRLERYKSLALEDLVCECKSLYKNQPAVLRDDIAFQNRQDWMLSESARRLCHAIWFIENMSRYHFNTQSTLLLDFADIALPCKEDTWQTETGQMQAPIKQPTLEKALRVLYVEKRLLKNIGDFARVLLVHGLYCQTWDVGASLNRPLLRWTPSSQKGNAESHGLSGPAWLPQIPLYNHWRNATCDCLDVLHWIANSDIAKAGTENTTVLHLHFARIVLLAPYEPIRAMAELLVSEDVRDGNAAERFQGHCQQVQKWITDDQFKARLALVHCGIFFWHVRRYSTDAFYEPTKVFLVTLVVWAYGSLCPPQQPNNNNNNNNSSSSLRGSSGRNRPRGEEDEDWSNDLDDISSIRLDRPCDDELVQLFIKRGRSMTATIMGVGSITAANGPLRMLREGRKLLSTLDRWPIRHRYLEVLTRLIDFCSQDRQWMQTGSSLRQPRQLATS